VSFQLQYFFKIIIHLELQNRSLASDVTTLESPLNDGYSFLAPTQNFRTVEEKYTSPNEAEFKILTEDLKAL
jgi:hypothetical protein